MTDTEQKTLIQPRKLANKNGELRYNWKVSEFSRLDGLLYSDLGEIKVHLTGKHDDRRRCLVKAKITANVLLECQTSFKPIEYQVDTSIVYCTVISEEQIADLDEEYEALLIEDGQVDIKQVIEDELILSLPIVANRASEELGINMSFGDLPQEDESKKNPFLVLDGLDLKETDVKDKQTKN